MKMKKALILILLFCFNIIVSICYADKIYKDEKIGIDFMLPISDEKDEDGKIWGVLLKNKKSRNLAHISSSEISKYDKYFDSHTASGISFIIVSLNNENIIEDEIYVNTLNGFTNDLCTYNPKGAILAMPEIIQATKSGYNGKYDNCGLMINDGILARRKSFQLTLSDGKGYFCASAAGRYGKQINVFGYTNSFTGLNKLIDKMNSVLYHADFDATFEKGYFEVEFD